MSESFFITGGTGKVGRRAADEVRRFGAAATIGTRSPSRFMERRFVWQDSETFREFAGAQGALLVAPPGATDALAVMEPALKYALAHGVSRFVLIGASSIAMDGPFTGNVYRWLAENAPHWVILRPSWFMQNFSEGQHAVTIRDEDAIYSATGNGRVPFIGAEDIGRVAACALVGKVPNGEVLLTGPELLSYEDVASELSVTLQRPIQHRCLSEEAMKTRFTTAGLPEAFAATLAAMDDAIRRGAEERLNDNVQRITKEAPQTFRAFAKAAAPVWAASSAQLELPQHSIRRENEHDSRI